MGSDNFFNKYIIENNIKKIPINAISSPLYGNQSKRVDNPKKDIKGANNNPEQAVHPAPKKPKNIPPIAVHVLFPFKKYFCCWYNSLNKIIFKVIKNGIKIATKFVQNNEELNDKIVFSQKKFKKSNILTDGSNKTSKKMAISGVIRKIQNTIKKIEKK